MRTGELKTARQQPCSTIGLPFCLSCSKKVVRERHLPLGAKLRTTFCALHPEFALKHGIVPENDWGSGRTSD